MTYAININELRKNSIPCLLDEESEFHKICRIARESISSLGRVAYHILYGTSTASLHYLGKALGPLYAYCRYRDHLIQSSLNSTPESLRGECVGMSVDFLYHYLSLVNLVKISPFEAVKLVSSRYKGGASEFAVQMQNVHTSNRGRHKFLVYKIGEGKPIKNSRKRVAQKSKQLLSQKELDLVRQKELHYQNHYWHRSLAALTPSLFQKEIQQMKILTTQAKRLFHDFSQASIPYEKWDSLIHSLTPGVYLIDLASSAKRYRHCLALIINRGGKKVENLHFIFDPNIGILWCNSEKFSDLLWKVLAPYFGGMSSVLLIPCTL